MDEQAPNYHREFLKSPQHAALGLLTLGAGFMTGMALPLVAAAVSVVDEFLMLVKNSPGPHPPTRLQTKVMSVRRARLLKLLQRQ